MDIVDIKTDRRAIGPFFHTPDGQQKWRGGIHLPRHKHTEKYVSLILAGGLEECGSRGRIFAGAGDVLMHGAFDTHLDRIFVSGAEVLNLRLPGLGAIPYGFGRVRDPDLIAKCAETDLATAQGLLCEQTVPVYNVPRDWPDLLAADLLEDPNRRLEDWADAHRLTPETLSRGFSRVFGIAPREFRAQIRARRAFEQIVEGTEVLSKVLERSGYYDLAHMSRSVRELTGAAPNSWLNMTSFKRLE